jgi:hypothetical protein
MGDPSRQCRVPARYERLRQRFVYRVHESLRRYKEKRLFESWEQLEAVAERLRSRLR